MTRSIDLSRIAPPDIVESLNFEVIYQEMMDEFRRLYPEWTAALESDPVVKLLEVAAYREMLVRARINDAARAVMLAYSVGSDLEHLAVLFGVARLENEDDTRLRYRTQLALEGFSTAGPVGAYVYHALSASVDVADIAVDSPDPGVVRVTILAAGGDGTADADLLGAIGAALDADDVRPLTDEVIIESAAIIEYSIAAVIHCYPGPSPDPVFAAAEQAAAAYVADQRRLGRDITVSGLHAALHQPGVQRVDLIEPAATVMISPREAGHCTAIDISLGDPDV